MHSIETAQFFFFHVMQVKTKRTKEKSKQIVRFFLLLHILFLIPIFSGMHSVLLLYMSIKSLDYGTCKSWAKDVWNLTKAIKTFVNDYKLLCTLMGAQSVPSAFLQTPFTPFHWLCQILLVDVVVRIVCVYCWHDFLF